jgi:hypothetical protein
MLAALAAWGLGEFGVFRFRPAITNVNMMGHVYRDASAQTRETAMLKGASWLLGTFGALLGAGMGLVGGYSSRNRRLTLIAAGIGFAAGAIAGAAAVWIAIPPYNRAEELTVGDLGRSLLLHCALWTALGAAAALAFGIALGERAKLPRAILGGVIGTIVGTLLYEVLGGLFFPLAETGKPFAETALTRLMALAVVALSSALGAVLLATTTPRTFQKTGDSSRELS